MTSASLHDSQVAIPLATLSAERTTNLYDLMDAAYDAEQIREHSRSLGHVPLIDVNPRGDKARAEELRTEARRLKHLGFQLAEQVRYNERTAGERVNGRLKDEFGGRHVRVPLTWSRWFGQLEGLVKVYSDCEITPSSSSAPALTGGCHGWHDAGSYPVIDDDDALWNCGNLAAGAQARAAALAREISNGLWAPASPPSGFSATVSGRPQAGQVHSAGWDMVLGPLMR